MTPLDRSQPPAPATVRDFTFPDVHRDVLPNGLSVFAVQHGVLPVITFRLVLHAGAEHDSTGEAGLAHLTAHALEAGTQTRSADRMAWEFEKLGAELGVEVLWDHAALTVTAPSDRAEAVLALLAEVVLDPALAAAEIDRLKNEQLAELLQRESEPRALASDEILRYIFAPGSPYHRPLPGVRESVRALTAEQVRAAYDSRWRPASAALIAVGDTSSERLQQLAARHFGNWTGSAQHPKVNVAPAQNAARIHLIHRVGSVQSEIRIGHVGVERKHPDYYSLVIANSILGGAFTSRLNMNLREKHGFTYGVRSGFGFRKQPGPFLIQTAVATDVTARAVDEIWKETTALLREGPTADEMNATRDYLSGTIPLELQTTEQIAAGAGEIFVFDLPTDYFAQYRNALRAVTTEQALSAAQRHIRPDDLIIAIVCDAHAVKSDIEALQLGTIQVHEPND